MKTFLKIRKILIILFYSIDKLFRLSENKVVALCYHSFSSGLNRYSVSADQFEKQILKIKKTSDFIGLEDLEKSVDSKSGRSKVLLTIDDGYKSVLKIRSVINKYKIPVILFVVAQPKKVDRKELDSEEKLLTWKDIIGLRNEGWVIGSHGLTHRNFILLDKVESYNEIVKSRSTIAKRIDSLVPAFAFPKGNFSSLQIEMVKEAKYQYGFSIQPGFIDSSSNNYLLPRTIIDSTHSIDEFPGVYSNVWFNVRKMTNWLKIWDFLLK